MGSTLRPVTPEVASCPTWLHPNLGPPNSQSLPTVQPEEVRIVTLSPNRPEETLVDYVLSKKRHYFRFLDERTTMTRVPPNKGKKCPAEVLTNPEVQRLIRACSHRAPTGIRNRALIVVLYRGGLRIEEALSLYPKDLDPAARAISVLNGKGRKARTAGLEYAAFAVIQLWLDVRKKMGINSRAPVFCTLRGDPVKTAYVRALFKRLAKKAGIEKRVYPHGLRTLAAQLARAGYPMNLIQQQLDHSSLATTSRYLDHIAPAQLIEAMQGRDWKLES